MPIKTPLAAVKEKFGDKASLVAALEKLTGEDLWVSRVNKEKGLAHVSNAKLLRLYVTFAEVKEKFGTRDKLLEAILELGKRTKDAGFREKLSAWPVPRLYDTYKAAAKRGSASSAKGAKSAPGEAHKAPAAKKAPKAAGKNAKTAQAKSTKKASR